MEIFPTVVQAVAGEDYIVYAYMANGKIKRYDAKPLISRGGVFGKLRDKDFFADRLTVINDTVAWDISGDRDPSECIDIDPFTIDACVDVTEQFKEIS
ncbi:MAG: DUF2442 domain-containing protein [Bacteroides sp.]|nr:DUF2442 domain-containing protein [Eubacterium sp.]MCM1419179.1 DUF2442 domain-containing protein [Roseburia sp.]MCM1463076.1 DUF2442 domain-containing protein [Bacteroides sp.]